jgi:hypothetical protein
MIEWRLAANNWVKRANIFNPKKNYAGGWNSNQVDNLYKKRMDDKKFLEMANNNEYPNIFEQQLIKHLTPRQIKEYQKHLKQISNEKTNRETRL